jgi:2-dehydropantoate 2-reductase
MMRHSILGAGGVGGLLGAVLAQAGEDVTLIVRPGTEQNYPRELFLDSTFGRIKAPVSIATSVAQPFHVLWITVKATQLEEALNSSRQDAKVEAVVPLLNGIDHVERLRQWFGRDKVIPATITVESERTAPGRIVHRSPFIRFNMIASGKDALATAIAAFRRFGFECNFVEDERTLLWSKLVFLAPVALSTTAARSPIGKVISDPARAAQLDACVREACAVASAAGANVDASSVLVRIKALPPGMRSSMEKDVANGNPPELDAISGPILRGAEACGIPVPATSELARVIRANLVPC